MITRDNYEIYFMDYLDGNLSPSDKQEMKDFLLINSDLQEMTEGMEEIRLLPPKLHFKDKHSLKKECYHECPDYYAIAAAENALTEEDRKFIHHKNNDKNYKALVKTYQCIKLKPDMEIRFNHKDLLYRRSKKAIIVFSLSGIAATILLILTFGFPLFHIEKPEIPFIISEEVQIFQPKLSGNVSMLEEIISEAETEKTIFKDIPANTEAKIKRLPIARIFSQKSIQPVYDKSESIQNISIIDNTSFPSEIILNGNAETWRASGSNIQSKNLISEVISASKNIAEAINRR